MLRCKIVLLHCIMATAAWADAGELDAYWDEYLAAHPVAATEAGVHTYDAQLDDWSAPAVQREVERLQRWASRLAKMEQTIDVQVVRHHADAQLLELQRIQGWRRRP